MRRIRSSSSEQDVNEIIQQQWLIHGSIVSGSAAEALKLIHVSLTKTKVISNVINGNTFTHVSLHIFLGQIQAPFSTSRIQFLKLFFFLGF